MTIGEEVTLDALPLRDDLRGKTPYGSAPTRSSRSGRSASVVRWDSGVVTGTGP